MKNMNKQALIEGVRNNAYKSLGNMAKKSGEVSLKRSCGWLMYEPQIPKELLNMSSKD